MLLLNLYTHSCSSSRPKRVIRIEHAVTLHDRELSHGPSLANIDIAADPISIQVKQRGCGRGSGNSISIISYSASLILATNKLIQAKNEKRKGPPMEKHPSNPDSNNPKVTHLR